MSLLRSSKRRNLSGAKTTIVISILGMILALLSLLTTWYSRSLDEKGEIQTLLSELTESRYVSVVLSDKELSFSINVPMLFNRQFSEEEIDELIFVRTKLFQLKSFKPDDDSLTAMIMTVDAAIKNDLNPYEIIQQLPNWLGETPATDEIEKASEYLKFLLSDEIPSSELLSTLPLITQLSLHIIFADKLMANGKPDEAIGYVNDLPDELKDTEYYHWYKQYIFFINGLLDQTIEASLEAIEEGFDNWTTYHFLGLSHWDKKNPQLAKINLEKSLKLNQKEKTLYRQLASFYTEYSYEEELNALNNVYRYQFFKSLDYSE